VQALIFVYGTLKEGFPNFSRNVGRRIAGEFRTTQPFPFYVVQLPNEDRAPWLMNRPGEGYQVSGQVFEVDSANLQAMDAFEEVGRPTGYVRVEVELEAVGEAPSVFRAHAYMKQEYQLAECLAMEGPFEAYTAELAIGYRLEMG
jgi:gamma-glutamylaminecyclotransferase